MSSTGYSANAKHSTVDIASLLRRACANSDHEFWPDDASLLDPALFDVTRLHGSRQVTDAYLLALAVTRDACFATLDGAIPLTAVSGATKEARARALSTGMHLPLLTVTWRPAVLIARMSACHAATSDALRSRMTAGTDATTIRCIASRATAYTTATGTFPIFTCHSRGPV